MPVPGGAVSKSSTSKTFRAVGGQLIRDLEGEHGLAELVQHRLEGGRSLGLAPLEVLVPLRCPSVLPSHCHYHPGFPSLPGAAPEASEPARPSPPSAPRPAGPACSRCRGGRRPGRWSAPCPPSRGSRWGHDAALDPSLAGGGPGLVVSADDSERSIWCSAGSALREELEVGFLLEAVGPGLRHRGHSRCP